MCLYPLRTGEARHERPPDGDAENEEVESKMIGLLAARGLVELERIRTREVGQAMVEYALLLFLIAVVSVLILSVLGTRVSSIFNVVVQDI